MLDWLKRDPKLDPTVDVGDVCLPVVVRRHPRAKRMTLRLSPNGREVRVSIPDWCPTGDAIEFARSRTDWLARQLETVPRIEPVAAGSSLSFRGRPVVIDHRAGAARKPVLDGTSIRIGGPEASVEGRVRRWLEHEALALLSADLDFYCLRAEQNRPKLALSRARRRWGSCAPDRTIRINWRLIMAPDHVRRSVVAHEVAHLVHFDHSRQFHALLAQIFEGDIKSANDWLKREGRLLYLPFG